MKKPNYKKIYMDIIADKFPDKQTLCNPILSKATLSTLDVIKLNSIIFNQSPKNSTNGKLKMYDKETIQSILNYQTVNNLNNIEVAKHFNLSRNTISKWKKLPLSI